MTLRISVLTLILTTILGCENNPKQLSDAEIRKNILDTEYQTMYLIGSKYGISESSSKEIMTLYLKYYQPVQYDIVVWGKPLKDFEEYDYSDEKKITEVIDEAVSITQENRENIAKALFDYKQYELLEENNNLAAD